LHLLFDLFSFKCATCDMTLTLKNYVGQGGIPYCKAHNPSAAGGMGADPNAGAKADGMCNAIVQRRTKREREREREREKKKC
jgi:hypothetical protein